MYRVFARSFLVACLAVCAASCSNNTSTISPTTPTTSNTTETFNGTLTTNGAVTHTFTATGPGTLTAALTTLAAASPLQTVSLALGTWNGTVCQVILANDKTIQGGVVTGNVSAASTLCVRIADADGSIPGPTAYTITVVHP